MEIFQKCLWYERMEYVKMVHRDKDHFILLSS